MRLAAYLDQHGLTPSKFAGAADVSVSIVTRLLRGERGVSLDTAFKIEDATGGLVTARECLPESVEAAS